MIKSPYVLIPCILILAACSEGPEPQQSPSLDKPPVAASTEPESEPESEPLQQPPIQTAATPTVVNIQPQHHTQPLVTPSVVAIDGPSLIDKRNYGFGYWLNGFRKSADNTSPDQLCIETGHYGFILDLAQLENARFSRINEGGDYNSSLLVGSTALKQSAPAKLSIQIASAQKVFTAKRSITGLANNARRLQDTRLWESGRYLQHFELQNLIFEDDSGNELSCNARLEVVGWPDSLTFNTEIIPTAPFVDGPTVGITGNGYNIVETPLTLHDLRKPIPEQFTLECWIKIPRNPAKPNNGSLITKNGELNDDSNIGFYMYGKHIEAGMNLGGGRHNRHTLRPQAHKLFNFDAWNHLALSYDGTTMHYYVNGQLQSSKAINKVRKPGKGNLQLGMTDKNGKSATYASFDQIRIWDRALSKSEITSHSQKPEILNNKKGLQYDKDFDARNDPTAPAQLWRNIITRIQLETTEQTWEARSPTIDTWEMGKPRKLTLNCDLTPKLTTVETASVTVHTADNKTVSAPFNPELNCHVAEIKKLSRNWQKGYTDIRNYDEFTLEIENSGNTAQEVPFMLYLRDVANITGLVPMLCDADGRPTGIPVQLSKNWHSSQLGAYLRAYALLPTRPGKQSYKLRIAYGFYGSLPSASHAQLSLVGYGGNGRWDQLAIGCWGETICFDVDRSCVDVGITDVRMLMARTGAAGKKWSWTNAGWGGDWLQVLDQNGKRHHPTKLKTAYFAHGPCLTDVRYGGHYGSQQEVAFKAQVQTLRTDDYARTFQKFHYTFDKEVSAKDAWLFKMGRTHNYQSPQFAYGNADGLIANEAVPNDLNKGEFLLEQKTIQGNAPWWVSFPGSRQTREDGKGNGYRALVIRDYRATFGGQVYTQPSISTPVFQVNQDGSKNIDLLLTAPTGVERFQPGDTIEMDLEWITLHRDADDYYGPNESYRKHLTEQPNSWHTTYREAIGNDLQIQVEGGTLFNNYPIQIQAEATDIRIQIEGGLGYVPIRFTGLPTATGYTLYQMIDGETQPLDQTVHGNDFWQTDYDARTNSYSRVYNLPLDGLPTSKWVLKKH